MRKSFTLLTLILLLACKSTVAYHIFGAEITYKHLVKNKYTITLNYYQDCAGTLDINSVLVSVSSSCHNYSLSLWLSEPVDTCIEQTNVCARYRSSTTCNGGTLFGFRKCTYAGTVDLGDTCNDWTISWTASNRTAASLLTDITYGGDGGFYVETHIDNSHHTNHISNGPVINLPPIICVPANDTSYINYSVLDPDGDSLAYEFYSPKVDAKSAVKYTTGLSYQKPLKASYYNLNASTGVFSVYPTAIQRTIVGILVKKIRHGIVVGSMMRDLQIIVDKTPIHHAPVITTLGYNLLKKVKLCAHDTLTLNYKAIDPDSGQRVFVAHDSLSHLSVSTDTLPNPNIHIRFIPDSIQYKKGIAYINLTLSDTACPYVNMTHYTILVNLVNCSSGTENYSNAIAQSISVYPTLVNGNSFGFTNYTPYTITHICIYDALGRVVKITSNTFTPAIPVNELPSGIYMVGFHLDNGYTLVKRIVIQR